MRQPQKFPYWSAAGFAAALVAGMVGMGGGALAASRVQVNPSIVLTPSQPSMSAVQNVIRDIRDREQRNLRSHARKPARTHGSRVH